LVKSIVSIIVAQRPKVPSVGLNQLSQ
jgi:hypothetical protein